MDQDVTWYGARPRPRGLCVSWGPRCPLPQRGGDPQIFGPCLLLPNGWTDEAGTWHDGRPQPRRVLLDGDPAPSPKRGRAPSPILRVEVENLEIGPEVGALPVIANFVVTLEQQRILVKTRSESV